MYRWVIPAIALVILDASIRVLATATTACSGADCARGLRMGNVSAAMAGVTLALSTGLLYVMHRRRHISPHMCELAVALSTEPHDGARRRLRALVSRTVELVQRRLEEQRRGQVHVVRRFDDHKVYIITAPRFFIELFLETLAIAVDPEDACVYWAVRQAGGIFHLDNAAVAGWADWQMGNARDWLEKIREIAPSNA